MGAEKASSWQSHEHITEKKDVLGKVGQKLEEKNVAQELPGLIADIAKFRYPQDTDGEQREKKRQSFSSALDQVTDICRTDSQLAKYSIRREDILDWCKVPMLEETRKEVMWEKMSRGSSVSVGESANKPPVEAAEDIVALRTGISNLGISNELMQYCQMSVFKRDPNSMMDGMLGLPKPEEGKQTYIVNLEFNIRGSKVKLFYDSSSPASAVIDALVASPGINPFVLRGFAEFGPDHKITKYQGRRNTLLAEGANLNTFLHLIRVASEEKKA